LMLFTICRHRSTHKPARIEIDHAPTKVASGFADRPLPHQRQLRAGPFASYTALDRARIRLESVEDSSLEAEARLHEIQGGWIIERIVANAFPGAAVAAAGEQRPAAHATPVVGFIFTLRHPLPVETLSILAQFKADRPTSKAFIDT